MGRKYLPENQRKSVQKEIQKKKVKNKTRSTTTMDPAFKSQRKGYQSSQKLLHDCQHPKYQLSS